MNSNIELKKEEIIDLLQRCWMTHDGMWFYHCIREFGIQAANRINKEAIKSLAPFEIDRMKKAIGIERKIDTYEGLKYFFSRASKLFIPDFMNATFTFSDENDLHWQFETQNCFAYKGIKRIGVIDRYECGVIYRLQCWFDTLGLNYSVEPQVGKCLMLSNGTCSGIFKFIF